MGTAVRLTEIVLLEGQGGNARLPICHRDRVA